MDEGNFCVGFTGIFVHNECLTFAQLVNAHIPNVRSALTQSVPRGTQCLPRFKEKTTEAAEAGQLVRVTLALTGARSR